MEELLTESVTELCSFGTGAILLHLTQTAGISPPPIDLLSLLFDSKWTHPAELSPLGALKSCTELGTS